MTDLDILSNPKLLELMTVQPGETLTYDEQVERLRKLRKVPGWTLTQQPRDPR